MLNPIIVFPASILFLYLLDVCSILIRRSTTSIRGSHHWANKLQPIEIDAREYSIIEVSEQYLPGYTGLIGSLPGHLSIASLIAYMSVEWENPYLQIIIALLIFYVVSYIATHVLLSYCRGKSNQMNRANKIE